MKAAYDKLCLSSLDSDYPTRLLAQIGASAEKTPSIKTNVNRMQSDEDQVGPSCRTLRAGWAGSAYSESNS